jgi:putative ABC transport system ATP-binding protein
MRDPRKSDGTPVIALHDVSCTREGASLRNVSLSFAPGSFNVLEGDGGAGLLLRLASLLEPIESGELTFLGRATAALDDATRTDLRSRQFGFVFSSPYLLPGMSTAENVAMPLFKILAIESAEAATKVTAALELAGLSAEASTIVDNLSRLDQQRVALARAIAHSPAALVLDRSDSGLAPDDAAILLETVRRLREETGVTVLTTFASRRTSSRSERVLAIEDGVICSDTSSSAAEITSGSAES